MDSQELNRLIMSHDPTEILNFYMHFEDQKELVQWMMNRPKGRADIYEVGGPKDIIVVIPTKSHDSVGARNCSESIFKGFHIIFVESGEDDQFFNYASNCNIGVTAALRYDPKWIILSNDDMVKIDDPLVIRKNLSNVDACKVSSVFTEIAMYHSYPVFLGYPNWVRNAFFYLSNQDNRMQIALEKKFGVDVVVQYFGDIQRRLFKSYTTVLNVGAFGIFSSGYIRNIGGKLFDDIYLNEFEELELSYNLRHSKLETATIPYRIGDMVGTTLGKTTVRKYRAIASRSYFNYKIKNGLLRFETDL